MKSIKLLFLSLFFSATVNAQTLYFPPNTGNSWDTLSPASLGWCVNQVDTLYDYLQTNNTKAFILLKDGKIVLEKYFGAFTQDSLWYWASAGKSLTAFVTGIAQQENYFSISDTSADYLGQGWTACTPAQEEKITIRHQLTMTSGLNDGVADPYCTIDTCLEYLADAGTRWAYHNGPYTLLDGVIQNATGVSLNSYTSQKVLQPTGMNGLFVPSGYNNLFISKPRSMARFGLLVLNRGNWNGNQIMTDTAYFNQMVNTSQNLNPSYGYLWWLNGKPTYMMPGLQFSFPGPLFPAAPADVVAALGKNGQFINVVPSQNIVFIRMGNAPSGGEVPAFMNDTIWQKLNLIMCNTNSVAGSAAVALQVSLYPNPAGDHAVVSLPGSGFDYALFDITGTLVRSKNGCATETTIETAELPAGMYLLRVTSAAGVCARKLLVQH
jgi:CubicO group peptidase (beta-lactamase class C family)